MRSKRLSLLLRALVVTNRPRTRFYLKRHTASSLLPTPVTWVRKKTIQRVASSRFSRLLVLAQNNHSCFQRVSLTKFVIAVRSTSIASAAACCLRVDNPPTALTISLLVNFTASSIDIPSIISASAEPQSSVGVQPY